MTTVYFATNRAPDNADNPTDFTEAFAPDIDTLRFGTATVPGREIFKENDLKKIGRNIDIRVAREKLHPSDDAKSKLGSAEIIGRIRKDMLRDGGRDAVILIHGYNYTFRESMVRAAQIGQWLHEIDPVMLTFAWPSLGQGVAPKSYSDERKRAEAAGNALGRAVLKAADYLRRVQREENCNGRVHLMAHSMGNWALRGGVQFMRTFVGDNIPPLFDQVILTAADEDDDTLGNHMKIAPLLRGCKRLTAYYCAQDAALKASDWVMGNPDRLGLSGPEDMETLPPKVSAVNVSPVIAWEPADGLEDWQTDPSGHQYYRNNEAVRQDVLQVLRGRDTDDIVGRTERGDQLYRLG